jgi:hypothetical protein
MKFSETTKEVISLAEAIRSYWDAELPKHHPDYPWIHSGEDSGPAPPEEKKLMDLLDKLSEADIYKLITIMYLGRGDFGTDNLTESYEQMRSTFESPAIAASQMMGKGPLADYLADGLAELKKNGIDVDQFMSYAINSGG